MCELYAMSDIGHISIELMIMGTETEHGYGVSVLSALHLDSGIRKEILEALSEENFFLDWNKRDLDNILTVAAQEALEEERYQ